MNMDASLCPRCKGSKNLCGLGSCPYLDKISATLPKISFSKSIFGSSPPDVFVGRYGYPKVYTGPMVPPEVYNDASLLNSPSSWYGQSIFDIIKMRTQLLRPSSVLNVKKLGGRFLETTQELALSSIPIDTEIQLDKVPKLRKPNLNFITAPMGPRINARKIALTENPVVPRKVDYIVSDTDMKSVDSVMELYSSNIHISHIQRLLSIGLLGKKDSRKLVPTRWSITATDDTLGKQFINEIKSFETVDKIELYSQSYIGNNIFVILLPRVWSYEMLETWIKGAIFAPETATLSDYEGYNGRKKYANNITGAYYAARLEIADFLRKRKKQASALVYREITDEYFAPLGVWVIRETTKDALTRIPKTFESLSDALNYISSNVRVKNWYVNSKLRIDYLTQTTLKMF